jgi:hypothetical protein
MKNDIVVLSKPHHFGDPCVFCGKNHDEVIPGACSAFYEKPRPPDAGEFFLSGDGQIVQAMFCFETLAYAIFKVNPYAKAAEAKE